MSGAPMSGAPLLSVLDLMPIRPFTTAVDAMQDTLRLAETADRLGFHRYWLAEHHATPGLACPSPEIMVGQVAARTRRIRVGSGGVMLSNYSALKVAESFRMLAALFPGRIDLGIGRAAGANRRTAEALANGPGALPTEQFPRRVADLLDFLHDTVPPDHPFADVLTAPVGSGVPEVWLLGSSTESARLAAKYGTAYSFAHFFTPNGGGEVIKAYAEMFRPSRERRVPCASVAVSVICDEDEATARRLAKQRDFYLSRVYAKLGGPYPSPAEVEGYTFSTEEQSLLDGLHACTIVGTSDRVRDQIYEVASSYGVSEILVSTITPDVASRLRSYELLADAFGLAEQPGRAAA